MNWLNTHRVTLGGAHISYGAMLVALAVLAVGFGVSAKVSARIRSMGGELGGRDHSRSIAARVAGYTLRVATVALALQVTGIDIASLLAAGTVLAVGIGIAMQKVAENFVSGVILFAERSIREGDVIEFEGHIAKVQRMGIRATVAVTLDEEEIIVPNSILAQSAVKNLTLTDTTFRLRAKVGVSYDVDVDAVSALLSRAAEALAWRDPSRPPVVLVEDFGASSIDFEVSVWSTDVWNLRRGRSELRKAIWRALREAEVSIPFPQLDVRFPEAKVPTLR
ncbi:MAG: mechanosensitive ion channel [Myxococcales bacterium]|nr:mechanosensitive ion channel [Myxococcales bacterium]